MNEATNTSKQNNLETQAGGGLYPEETSVSFADILRRLAPYRRMVFRSFLASCGLVILVFCLLFLLVPTENMASIRFRLEFEGANTNLYPNGSPFSSADIIAPPVIAEVYDANNLKDYFLFEAFQKSLSVIQTNMEVQLLEKEYSARLSDTRLNAVDRQRIQEEFQMKRKALLTPTFDLYMVFDKTFSLVPRPLVNKVLSDILGAWAMQADKIKGALRFKTDVYSTNIFQKETLLGEDYLIAIDILRNRVEKVLKSIDKLQKIPGASTLRVGENQISLAEIRSLLEDANQFRLEPLSGMIRAAGISRDPALTVNYLQSQFFQNNLATETASQRVRTYEDSMRVYMQEKPAATPSGLGSSFPGTSGSQRASSGEMNVPALIPQFGESFLDRIISIANRNEDTKFRQKMVEDMNTAGLEKVELERKTKYYETTLKAVQGKGGSILSSEDRQQLLSTFRPRFEGILNDIIKTVDQLQLFYNELSRQMLNPKAVLYSTEPAVVTTSRALDYRKLLIGGFVFVFMVVTMTIIGCLVHASYVVPFRSPVAAGRL